MNNNIKMVSLFLLQSIITLVIFFLLTFNGKYAGGDVGMAPFLTIITLAIQIIISLIVYFVVKFILVLKSQYIFFIINMVIFILVLFILDRASFYYIFIKDDLSGFLIRNHLLSYFISTVLALIVYFVVEKLKI